MIRTCSSCGRRNRVPSVHLAHRGKCGACKVPFAPLDRPLEVDTTSFDDIIANARVPVLVDFWAEWCGPCRMAAPVVSRLAKEHAGRAIVLKVDTEAQPELAARYEVRGIPNFIVFRNGAISHQQAGLVDQKRMAAWLD